MFALLACAVAAVIGAEWPRLSARYGNEARRRRDRTKRKGQLKLLRTETEEFAASVERDAPHAQDANTRRRRVAFPEPEAEPARAPSRRCVEDDVVAAGCRLEDADDQAVASLRGAVRVGVVGQRRQPGEPVLVAGADD